MSSCQFITLILMYWRAEKLKRHRRLCPFKTPSLPIRSRERRSCPRATYRATASASSSASLLPITIVPPARLASPPNHTSIRLPWPTKNTIHRSMLSAPWSQCHKDKELVSLRMKSMSSWLLQYWFEKKKPVGVRQEDNGTMNSLMYETTNLLLVEKKLISYMFSL